VSGPVQIGDATLHLGDCLAVLATLPEQSVQTCITSPPYFGLRDYGHEGQIGLEQTPDEYVAKMVAVFREVRRVLADDGTVFLNLGDSYFSSSVRREAPCGTSDKEPEGSIGRGCLCGSLCGACRRAYQIGKSHSDGQRAPTPALSPYGSIREHTESPSDHLPTSGSSRLATRSEAAIPASARSQSLESGQLPASVGSMPFESSSQHPEGCRQSDMPSVCPLCEQTLERDAQKYARMPDCTCGIGSPSGASTRHMSDSSSSDSAYPYSTTASLKPKDLIGIPWRVAFALQADGWYLRQDIIWHKPNPMPESVRDRCTKAHEYIFLLSKSAKYRYDYDAIAEPLAQSSIDRVSQNNYDHQAGSDRVPGKTNGPMKAVVRFGGSKYGEDSREESRTKSGNAWEPTGVRNRRSVWTVATQPYSGAHFATFPPALIEPCVLAGCPAGGVVLDPFTGSGTTGQVALDMGRKFVGIELNSDYLELAVNRIKPFADQMRLFA
jgi:DNA modification methylase